MMQATVRVKITCTSSNVTAIRRDEPMPAGAVNQGELLDKADFRPTPSGRLKEFTTPGGVVLRARAPRWALNPITARAYAGPGKIVLTKSGGDPLGTWGRIGLRPTFEWCLVVPADTKLSSEPTEVSGHLIAFLPNGGDIDGNVLQVAHSCTIADVDRLRGILAAASASPEPDKASERQAPPPVANTPSGPPAPPRTGPPAPPRSSPPVPPSTPPRGGPPPGPPPRIDPPRPN
jgi:hypothetical protein